MKNQYTPPTRADDELILQMMAWRDAGHKPAAIAAHIGKTPNAVRVATNRVYAEIGAET